MWGIGQKADDKKIRNCRFLYECSIKWSDLTPMLSGDQRIRFCEECQRCVFLCKTDKQLKKAIRDGRCVAVSFVPNDVATDFDNQISSGPTELVGMPSGSS